jgi:hypothetical protein
MTDSLRRDGLVAAGVSMISFIFFSQTQVTN